MKLLILLFSVAILGTTSLRGQQRTALPSWIKGNFADDYGEQYNVSDTQFVMKGAATYHIVEWNEGGQYLLAQNDTANRSDKGLFTRIDYMRFPNMQPFTWGYCLTVYRAKSSDEARATTPADRGAPRKGCNGFPFSRMKPIDPAEKIQ